jgi:2,4-dienoyl-CoA reductase-like NADH-dependent reductase (Old Yellow Enzyme family)
MSKFKKTDVSRETTPTQRLFTPLQVGPFTLTHRVVMAPFTRSRSEQPGDIPGDLMLEYYTQRASESGLIISEGTSISIAGRGWFGAPGMYSDEQVPGWKRITSAIHGKGGHIFSQLWHEGRSSHASMTNGAAPVAPSIDPQYWLDSSVKHFYPQWLAEALAASDARYLRNSRHCRGLSQSRRALKSRRL